MVDDAFYILKKCGARALATGSVQCVAALVGELNDSLANTYRAALQVRVCWVYARFGKRVCTWALRYLGVAVCVCVCVCVCGSVADVGIAQLGSIHTHDCGTDVGVLGQNYGQTKPGGGR
jgi:hypothetical protein